MALRLFNDAIELRGDPVSPRLVTGLIELPPDVPVSDPEKCIGLIKIVHYQTHYHIIKKKNG